MSCCFAPDLPAGVCVKRYGPRLSLTHDYFDKVLSRKGAAPATGRDTLINPFPTPGISAREPSTPCTLRPATVPRPVGLPARPRAR